MHMKPYLSFATTAQSQVYMTTKIDKEIAKEISKITGLDIKTSQIEYYRRKNNIAACGENWGGKRDGAGRKQKQKHIPIPVHDGTTVIDYGDSDGAVQILHLMDTYRLSHSTVFGQGLVGGTEFRVTSEGSKRLKEILNKKRVLGEKQVTEILDAEETWSVEKEFEDANMHKNGKLNKNGNPSNSQLARLCS